MIYRAAVIFALIGIVAQLPYASPAGAQESVGGLEKKLNQLMSAGRYSMALPVAKRIVVLVERRGGRNGTFYGAALNNLGNVYFNLGKYREAERHYRQSVEIKTKALGGDHHETATSMSSLAIALMRQQRLSEAKTLVARVLSIYERQLRPGHPLRLAAIYQLGVLSYYQGDYTQSNAHYRHALQGYIKAYGELHPRVVEVLGGISVNLEVQGKFGEAEKLNRRQIAIMEKLYRPDHPQVGRALHDLAGIYLERGLDRKALPLYERALAIRTAALGEDHVEVGHTLTALGSVYWTIGQTARAEEAHRRAISLLERSVGSQHPYVASVFENYGNGLGNVGRYSEAETNLRRALAIWKSAYGNQHLKVAQALNNLAGVTSNAGQHETAKHLYLQSLKIERAKLGDDHPRIASRLRNLGLIAGRQGRIEEAYDYHSQASAIREKRQSSIAGSGRGSDDRSWTERESFVNLIDTAWILKKKSERRISDDELANTAFEAAQLFQRSTSDKALSQMAVRFSSGQSELAALVRRHQDLSETERVLDSKYLQSLSRSNEDKGDAHRLYEELQKAKTELDRLEADMTKRFPEFSELTNPRPLSLAVVQRLLRPGEALVYFMQWNKGQLVWAATNEQYQWFSTPLTRKDAQTVVTTLRRGLDLQSLAEGKGVLFDLQAAYELYQTMFAPLEAMLADKAHLMVVTDGALTGLPFHVLVTEPPATGKPDFSAYRETAWLARRHAITTLPSVATLRALRVFAKGSDATRPFIGYGDPVFSTKQRKARSREKKKQRVAKIRAFSSFFRGASPDLDALRDALVPLPDTADELKAVAKSLGAQRRDIVLGHKASERNVKRAKLEHYRVVYFATHGLVAGDIESLAEPALALTIPRRASRLDDGLLTASEVANLKLNAEMVVLSACNTAVGGKPGAEALSGLARAFFYAGARSMLVSHWPVQSEAAVKLTTKMFDETTRNPSLGRTEALRRSMMSLIEDMSEETNAYPAIWAPFVVVGEGGVPATAR